MKFKPFLWMTSLVCIAGTLPALAEMAPLPQAKQDTPPDAQPILPWQLVTSTPGRYLVELPGPPEEKTSTTPLLGVELNWFTHSVTIPTVDEPDGVDLFEYYMVSYADLPRELSYEYSQKEILDAMVAQLIDELEDDEIRATLETEAVAFKGLPARVMTADCFEQFCVGGIALTPDRLYVALAIDDDLESFDYFFESLTFIP
jgi:hypothetical protein